MFWHKSRMPIDTILKPFNDRFHFGIVTIANMPRSCESPEASADCQTSGKGTIMKFGYTDVVSLLFLYLDRAFEGGM